jgi:uncharacterized membrane protein
MKNKTIIPHYIIISLGFTLLLLTGRMVYSGTLKYVFLGWNLFLAFIPYCLGLAIERMPTATTRWKQYLLLAGWLLFLPNAPYIITDLVHLRERLPVPFYYDMVLCFMAAFNGLLLGLLSLEKAEHWWRCTYTNIPVNIFRSCVLLLCGFGIYLGRYGRFNSWDFITNPGNLMYQVAQRVLYPLSHPHTCAVTLLFALMLGCLYALLRQIKKSPAL